MKDFVERRNRLGLSQRELGEKLGIPVRTIEDWERGARTPNEWTKRLLVEKLDQMIEEEKKMIHTVDGIEYSFEVWHGGQNDVLVALYTAETGETFGIWTAETDSLPETQEEAGDFIRNMDWAVEDMETLRREGFKRAK